MNTVKITGLEITLPDVRVNEADVAEWLDYNLGMSHSIQLDNPLCDYSLRDCIVNAETFTWNGRNVNF